MWDYENQPNGQTHAATKIPLDDEWIHLTVTRNGNKTVSFYINGEADDATNDLPTARGNDVNIRVGDDGKRNKGAGTIDKLVIFRRELSVEEIKSLMQKGGKKFLDVEHTGKLTTTWVGIKNRF